MGVGALLGCSVLFSALLAEFALRVLAAAGYAAARQVAGWDPYAVKVEPFGAFGYRQRPGALLTYRNGTSASANGQGFRGPDVTVPKPAGTFRIVLLGGSTSHGWHVNDDQTIDAYLRARLAADRPDLHIEVVNLAYDGYDSYQDWQRLVCDGVPLQPDLVIENAGVNDVRNARYQYLRGDPDPRTLIWEGDMRRQRREIARGGPTLWTRFKHWSYLARLPGVVRKDLGRWRPGSENVGQHGYPDGVDNLERNAVRIARVARALGVPLLFSTPPSALALPDAPRMNPRSYWIRDAATTQQYFDTMATRLQGLAARLRAAGQPVAYIAPKLSGRLFLDDVHLTPDGNREMAAYLAVAITPYLPSKQ